MRDVMEIMMPSGSSSSRLALGVWCVVVVAVCAGGRVHRRGALASLRHECCPKEAKVLMREK